MNGERRRLVRSCGVQVQDEADFDEWDRFNLTVAALSKESIQSVFQLVTSPSEDEPYTALKEGLLHNHQLTDYQKIEKLPAPPIPPRSRPSPPPDLNTHHCRLNGWRHFWRNLKM